MRQTADCASASQQNFPPHSPHSLLLGPMATHGHDDEQRRRRRPSPNCCSSLNAGLQVAGRWIYCEGCSWCRARLSWSSQRKARDLHLRGALYAFGSLPSRTYKFPAARPSASPSDYHPPTVRVLESHSQCLSMQSQRTSSSPSRRALPGGGSRASPLARNPSFSRV